MGDKLENKRGRISIKDVAKLAGVSPTTVSRVINNSDHPVNSKTREIVNKAVEKLNYQPNRMAQGLIKNKSNIIGVIVHDISDAYFGQMVKGIEEVTFEYDYLVNIFNTNRDINKELQAVNMLKAHQAEAIIFTGGNLLDDYYNREMKRHIEDLKRNGCYVLSVTSHPYDIKNIELGNKLAARIITEYLVDKGHKKIAYVSGPEILNTTQQRLIGYKEILAENKIDLNKKLIIPGDFSFAGGRIAAKSIVSEIKNITAVVASNDESALGLLWQLEKYGIRVPEDISVVGIGNIPSSQYSYPPLTTISLPLYKLGMKVGDYILSQLNVEGKKSNSDEDINVKIGLVERDSVREIC